MYSIIRCLVSLVVAFGISSITASYAQPELNISGQFDPTPSLTDHLHESHRLSQQQVDDLKELLKQHPQEKKLHYLLGSYYQKSGFLDLAIQEYIKLERQDPKSPEPFLSLVKTYLLSNRDVEALNVTEQAISKFPDNAHFRLLEFMILTKQHKQEEASAALAKSMHDIPHNLELRYGYMISLIMQKKNKEVFEEAQKILQEFPKSPEAKLYIGMMYLSNKQHKNEGLKHIKDAYEEMPYDPRTSAYVLMVMMQLKQFHDALEPALVILSFTGPNSKKELQIEKSIKSLVWMCGIKLTENTVDKIERKFNNREREAELNKGVADIYDALGQPALAARHYIQVLNYANPDPRNYLSIAQYLNFKACDHVDALKEYKAALPLLSDQKQREELQLKISRLEQRSSNKNNDLAWQLKDGLYMAWATSIVPKDPMPTSIPVPQFIRRLMTQSSTASHKWSRAPTEQYIHN